MDDGWGAPLSIKGRELEVATLFADISSFTERTADMSPVETLAYVNTFFTWMTAEALEDDHLIGIISEADIRGDEAPLA